MKRKPYVILAGLFITLLAGCSKPDDTVSPASDTDLLIRKWAFPEITVKTDVKSYTVPTSVGPLISDDNKITIQKGGTYSYLDNGKSATGKWALTDKTLTLTSADNEAYKLTVTTLTSTNLELASTNVNLTKGKDLTDSKVYTAEERSVGVTSLLLLSSLDKQNGGSVDFTKEPEVKSVQFILKGRAE